MIAAGSRQRHARRAPPRQLRAPPPRTACADPEGPEGQRHPQGHPVRRRHRRRLGQRPVTGGFGRDTFTDGGGNDTLVEAFDADFGIYDNLFVVGVVKRPTVSTSPRASSRTSPGSSRTPTHRRRLRQPLPRRRRRRHRRHLQRRRAAPRALDRRRHPHRRARHPTRSASSCATRRGPRPRHRRGGHRPARRLRHEPTREPWSSTCRRARAGCAASSRARATSSASTTRYRPRRRCAPSAAATGSGCAASTSSTGLPGRATTMPRSAPRQPPASPRPPGRTPAVSLDDSTRPWSSTAAAWRRAHRPRPAQHRRHRRHDRQHRRAHGHDHHRARPVRRRHHVHDLRGPGHRARFGQRHLHRPQHPRRSVPPTSLDTNAGNDTVIVRSISGPPTVDTGTGPTRSGSARPSPGRAGCSAGSPPSSPSREARHRRRAGRRRHGHHHGRHRRRHRHDHRRPGHDARRLRRPARAWSRPSRCSTPSTDASPSPWPGAGTTAQLDYDVTAAKLQAALEALPGIGAGNVVVSKAGGGWAIAWAGALAGEAGWPFVITALSESPSTPSPATRAARPSPRATRR